jgi:hypothetical protein
MKLVQVNLPNAEAAVMTEKGDEVIVIIRDKGNVIIKVISALDDVVGDLIEVGTPLFTKLVQFFTNIFSVLPTYIEYHGSKYRLTLQPAFDKINTKVLYLLEDGYSAYDGKTVLFLEEGISMPTAKKAMRKRLKSQGYFK